MSLQRIFILSASLVLMLTALAKLITAWSGDEKLMTSVDPVFGMSFKFIFLAVGGIEIAVAVFCVFGKKMLFEQATVLCWLALSMVLYRVGLYVTGYNKPCGCIGDVTEALGISEAIADKGLKFILAYLVIGSSYLLIANWNRKNQSNRNIDSRIQESIG